MARKSRKQSFPRTVRQLRAWLRDTPTGQQLVRELASQALERECRICERARPYPKVLVVTRQVGDLACVQVAAEKGVSVRVAELVDVPEDDPVIWQFAEDLLIAQLPRAWRHLGVKLMGGGVTVIKGLPAERRFRALSELRTLRELDAWVEKWLSTNLKSERS